VWIVCEACSDLFVIGTLITHWETAKYAGLSFLGILSLLSAVLATLYSSAAAATVQPMLRDGNWDNGLVLAGRVKSDFANINYLKEMCQTPIRTDKNAQGETCLQMEHAGQGYHNFQRYLSDWDLSARNGNGTSIQKLRPQGFGLLYENTTVTGQWIDIVNTTETSQKHGRVINNVTMAMPHSGVFAAARDQRNGILQPEELNSEGTYSLRASVPSPVLNVLCVNMNKTELEPIVYDAWPNDDEVDLLSWGNVPGIRDNATTTNKTVVDDIFGWDVNDTTTTMNWPPVFGKYPLPFNTIMNHTSFAWGRSAIYLLGQGGPDDVGMDGTGIFSLCKLHLTVRPGCSTRHNVTGSGATMEALCEDPNDKKAFVETGDEVSVNTKGVANWRDIGTDWSNSLSLGTGLMDANASTSRLLTQLVLKPTNPDPENLQVDLSNAIPSLGEALAVLAGCTLLLSMVDTPFVTFWVRISFIFHCWNLAASCPPQADPLTQTTELFPPYARRVPNAILQRLTQSPTICIRGHAGRFQSMGTHTCSRLRHERLRPHLLHLPSRTSDGLLRTAQPLRPRRQLAPVARPRRFLRRRPRRQTIHGELVR